MPKAVLTEEVIPVPQGVKVDVKTKIVSVEGPLGKIKKSFKNIPILMRNRKAKDGSSEFELRMWFQDRRRRSSVKTLRTLVENMVTSLDLLNIILCRKYFYLEKAYLKYFFIRFFLLSKIFFFIIKNLYM